MTIEERVQRLEATCHRWRIAASLLASFSSSRSASVKRGQRTRILRSSRFASGIKKAARGWSSLVPPLGTFPNWGTAVKGSDRFTGLLVLDEGGAVATNIAINSLVLVSKEEHQVTSLSPSGVFIAGRALDGRQLFGMVSVDKVGIANAILDKEGCAILDDDGKTRAILGTAKTVNKQTGAKTKSAIGALTLFDADGHVLFQKT